MPTPNLSNFKRLVWLEVMLPIMFFLADKVFPVISLLEKNRLLLKFEKRSCVPPPKRAKETFLVAKSICESSLIFFDLRVSTVDVF